MNCDACEPELIDYAHGEIDDETRTEVARHLAGCSACALEYCRLQADLQGIVAAHAEAPRARVYHMLRRKVAAAHGPSWWLRTREVFARPVPMYGAVLAGLLPVVAWVATSWTQPVASTAMETGGPPPVTTHDAALRDYDGTEVLPAYQDVL